MKTICIVGAGPAGLAGAKTLLQTGQFEVSVFEKCDRIGGIWALDEDSEGGLLCPHTPTNLSRFTVGFSDLDWNSVDLGSKSKDAQSKSPVGPPRAPLFPKAWQVNRYLEEYRKRYIPERTISLGTRVIEATRILDLKGGSRPKWMIKTQDQQSQERTLEFDHLLIASGFFSCPRPLGPKLSLQSPTAQHPPIKIIHSSEFRKLRDLLPKSVNPTGKTILIFGGGNSSGEVAAAVAQQLSDARFAPDAGNSSPYEDCRIVHVTPRPLYAVSPFSPFDEDCQIFCPVDLKLYDLSKRPDGPITARAGSVPKEVKSMIHNAIQTMIGGDQSDLGYSALIPPSEEPRTTAYVTLSETYSEFVRSDVIQPVAGRVEALKELKNGTIVATVKTADSNIDIDDIVAVIHATGFIPSTALEFIADGTKDVMEYDESSPRLPLILEGYQTMSPRIPELALLGFYEGPYWPIIELQACLTAKRWLAETNHHCKEYENPTNLQNLRKSLHESSPNIPQYWFGDYLGYMEQLASELGLTRNDGAFQEREGCVSPARYLSPTADRQQADSIMKELHEIWQACTVDGKYIARAAFRALQGNWLIHRTIDSSLPTFPSGVLEGTASFHPRFPTSDPSGRVFDFEYLYVESGTLALSNGASMPATRRYVYRYSEADDLMSVWFVRPDDDLRVDYLFHDLTFVRPQEAKKLGACVAKADHLCVQDMYWTEYKMPIKGIALHEFEVSHTVKGPEKNYVATTKFRRPPKKGLPIGKF